MNYENARFSVMGDSISTLKGYMPDDWRIHYEGEVHIEGVETPADTWWGRVIEHFGGSLLKDSAYSGSTVEGFGFPAGNSAKRVEYLLGDNGETPDVVLVFMGINDYGWGGARNQVFGGSSSATAKPEDIDGPAGVQMTVARDALAAFAAAYDEMIARIRQLAPAADIWCATLCAGRVAGAPGPGFSYSYRGIELDEYNDAIRQAAANNGAHVADFRAFGLDYDAVDWVHPSALGMRQLADMMISQMEAVPVADAIAQSANLSVALPAQRCCDKTTCDGCEFTDTTATRWTLHCMRYESAETEE